MSFPTLAVEVVFLACSDYLLLAREGLVRDFKPTQQAVETITAGAARARNKGRGRNPHPVDRRLRRLEIKRLPDLEILCAFFGEPLGALLRAGGIPLHPYFIRQRLAAMEARGEVMTGHFYVNNNNSKQQLWN